MHFLLMNAPIRTTNAWEQPSKSSIMAFRLDFRWRSAEDWRPQTTIQPNEMKNTRRNLLAGTALFALMLQGPGALAQGDCLFTANWTVTEPTCGQTNGAIDLSVTGGTAPYYYTWSTGALTQDISGLGVGSYWVFIADFTQCYYKVDIVVDCEEEVNCQFRTQTQGGWGASPNGNNPAMYLQNNFATCFPAGVTIGCATGNTLTLTSSTAVKNFLPSGSTPSLLPNDMVNPGGGYNNVLAGQLVAATINVTADACDPSFGAATGWLGDAVYAGGTFAGWTVQAVIDAANQFIGGCGGAFTASQFNDALTDLNENYVGGTMDNGDILCPKKDEENEKSATMGHSLLVSPNPSTGAVRAIFSSSSDAAAVITVLDMAGRNVVAAERMGASNGLNSTTLDLSGLNAGSYLIMVEQNGVRSVGRVLISR